MGLDFYVMPLWRFKAGDFRSAIEAAIGFRPNYLSTDGIAERPARVGWFAKWRSRRRVAAMACPLSSGADSQ